MNDKQVLDSRGFDENYKILKETADWLSRQQEPKIDELVPKVEKAMQAYRLCKERLDSVQQTLGQYLRSDSQETDEADEDELNDNDQETDDDKPF